MNRFLLLLILCSAQGMIAQPISWISSCAERNFCMNPGSCTQGKVLMFEQAVTNCPSPNINYSYRLDLDNNGTIDVQSSDDTLQGVFLKGTHKVIWRAADGCGAAVQCTYLFHIKDCSPPNLICEGLTQTLDLPDCDATFSATQFITTLNDNCIPASQIEKGIRRTGTGSGFTNNPSLTFENCDKGVNPVEVWVRDNNGLTNSCNINVIIQNSEPLCNCGEELDLQTGGCIRSANNKSIANYRVKTTMKSLPSTNPPFNKVKSILSSDSCYSIVIPDIPSQDNYEVIVQAERPGAVLNGITTLDLVMISKHILGVEALTSAYQLKAADVNKSNSVTTFDIVEIRKLLLGIVDTFTLVPSWGFFKPLADPSILSAYTTLRDTYHIQLTNLSFDTTFSNLNFVGVKYGDLNYTAALMGDAEDRSDAEPLLLKTNDRWLKAGEEAEVQFSLNNDYALDGWQIALSADPYAIRFLSVDGVAENDYVLNGSELRALSYDRPGLKIAKNDGIFTLRIKALEAVQLSQALHLNAEKWQPAAYVLDRSNKTSTRPLVLQFGTGSIKFFGLSPNPFRDQADFNMSLDEPGLASLEIFSVEGRRVYAENFELEQGYQSIRLSATSLPDGKIYFYRLLINGEVFSGKMIRG